MKILVSDVNVRDLREINRLVEAYMFDIKSNDEAGLDFVIDVFNKEARSEVGILESDVDDLIFHFEEMGIAFHCE